jgi:thiol:disulfide interchange protein DsbC
MAPVAEPTARHAVQPVQAPRIEAFVLRIRRLLVPVTAALAIAGAVHAAPQAKSAPKPDIRAEIAKRLEIKVEDVRPSAVAGLYEVSSGTEVGYVSADGRFYVDGDVFDMGTKLNITEERRKQGRLALLASVADEDAIVFAPKTPARHTVTVFTDVNCVHCRRLHSEMGELNRLGIRVRYLMYPRGGPGTEAWKQAENVWCSADRKDALTRAKRGEDIEAARCDTPIAAQYQLGRDIGVTGTPGIVTETGEFLAGYASAAHLASYLDEPQKVAAQQ